MWVLDVTGSGVNLNHVNILWLKPVGAPLSDTFEVAACQADYMENTGTSTLLKGTESECESYISDLVERLNMRREDSVLILHSMRAIESLLEKHLEFVMNGEVAL